MHGAVFTALLPFLRQIRNVSLYFSDDDRGTVFSKGQSMATIKIEWRGNTPDGFAIEESEELKVEDNFQDFIIYLVIHNVTQMKLLKQFFREHTSRCQSLAPIECMIYLFSN